jgi:protein-S-isoprenylcysteine O-methyltransferase Ste14
VRNPVAACLVAALLAEAIALSSTGIFLLFVVSMGLAHAQVVLMEEPLLKKRFGQEYVNYLSRVPRWIPRRPPTTGS